MGDEALQVRRDAGVTGGKLIVIERWTACPCMVTLLCRSGMVTRPARSPSLPHTTGWSSIRSAATTTAASFAVGHLLRAVDRRSLFREPFQAFGRRFLHERLESQQTAFGKGDRGVSARAGVFSAVEAGDGSG
ncbi:hypothetical protein [Streptomyces sp. NPDC002566]|uniref:hypothetical protein n=1 Tax=Streptomyces sp. NPDC002566 TaxID=3364650 RepID=UPI003689C3F6